MANRKQGKTATDGRRGKAGLPASYPWYLANRPVAAKANLDVLDKFTGKVATRVPLVGAAEVDRAIAAAHQARGAMARFPPDARRDVLEHCVRRFTERHDELALSLCIEAGKPIKDARGEVDDVVGEPGLELVDGLEHAARRVEVGLAQGLDDGLLAADPALGEEPPHPAPRHGDAWKAVGAVPGGEPRTAPWNGIDGSGPDPEPLQPVTAIPLHGERLAHVEDADHQVVEAAQPAALVRLAGRHRNPGARAADRRMGDDAVALAVVDHRVFEEPAHELDPARAEATTVPQGWRGGNIGQTFLA